MKRFRTLIACILLIPLANAHWAALKGVALTTMAVNYSKQAGVAEGLRQTFDGKHPCKMCKSIKQVEQQTKAPDTSLNAPTRDSINLLSLTQHVSLFLSDPPLLGAVTADAGTYLGPGDQPPTPPPG